MTFHARLTELIEKATKGPWWKWPDMPYLFSGDKTQKNAYMHAVRVCRVDYTEADGELIAYLVNHAEAIEELVRAAEAAYIAGPENHELADALEKLNRSE